MTFRKVAAGKASAMSVGRKIKPQTLVADIILLQEKRSHQLALHQRIAELQTQHDDARRWLRHDARMVSQGYAGILWSIGSISLLHRSSRLCGTPQRSGSSTAELAVAYGPLAPISRPTGSGRCRTQKAGCRISDPFLGENGFTPLHKAQIELRELRTAQQNVEAFFRGVMQPRRTGQQEVK